MGQFDDKVVLITGAAGGLAAGIVKKFGEEGAKLVLVDRDTDALQQRVDSPGAQLNDYLITGGNLGEVDEMQAVVKSAEDKFGTIDILVNTVGGFASGDPVHEADISVLEKQFFLNTRITFIVLGQVAKHMVDNGVKGSLTTILAKAGLSGGKNSAAYAASKAAAHRIVQSMALELKEHDIRVNGIMPRIIDTPANREAMPDSDFSKWTTPEQIAQTIAFLSSDAASPINGEAIGV